jgi:hypothetical protein
LRPAADLDRMAQEAETSLPTEPDAETWYYQGALFAYCGKKQAALHLLQSAVEQNYCAHENLLSDPLLAKLRTDTAFDKVLTAAGACQEKTMTGASILWECLEREGVKHVFRLSRRRDSPGL